MRPDEISQAVMARDEVARHLASGANGADGDARQRLESYLGELRTAGVDLLGSPGVIVVEHGRLRIRNRLVMRYYARTLQHLLQPRRTTH